MKQLVVISAGGQLFEFEGQIIESSDEHLLLSAPKGEIYIERKYVVFIQFLREQVEQKPLIARPQKTDKVAARLIKQQLKKDPLAERLEEQFIPPSQLPDNFGQSLDEDDSEVMRNVYSSVYGPEHPIAKSNNLQDAVKTAMNSEEDFSMGGPSYSSPFKTILSKYENPKKNRND